jgi:Ca2+-binding RTX toxin-like protein
VGNLGGARNVLDGGEGADVLIGGSHDDVYYVDNLGDQIFEGTGIGAAGDRVYSSVSYTLGTGLDHLVLTGSAPIEGTGNALPNDLDGSQNSAPNRLRGGAGDDIYRLGPGDTFIENPDEGVDTVEIRHRGGGTHRLEDYPHIENLTFAMGSWGNIVGNAASNRLEGDDDDNEIRGGAGDDMLLGKSGANRLYGGDGDDQLLATSDYHKDYQSRVSSPSHNFLDGGTGNDTLRITSTSDRYFWGTGDRLRGGSGDDTLEGGDGGDVYEYNLGDGNDAIFDESGNDTVAFGEGIAAERLAITRQNNDLLVQLADGSEINVRYWFSPQAGGTYAYRIERFTFNDGGATLTASDVERLADGNHSPVVGIPLEEQQLQQDSPFTYQLPEAAFADPDGDVLSISATLESGDPLPAWLDFDAEAHRFLGTPGNEDVGELMVRVAATDPGGLAATDTFQLTVANVNDAPEAAAALTDTSAQAGQVFHYEVGEGTFRDIDPGDALSLAATLADGSPLPDWLNFDAEAGLFSGTPEAGDIGTFSLSVTATDSAGASAATQFQVAVEPAPGITLTGTTGDETILGTSGNDTLSGGTGTDWVQGDAGDDTLGYAIDGTWSRRYVAKNVGSPGHTGSGEVARIAGKGRSFDRFAGGEGADRLIGTAQDDALFLDDRYSPAPQAGARLAGIEQIDAGDGDDVIDLTSTQYAYGAVTLLGGEGNDVLWASAGDDRLDGGPGNDQLDGGAGADRYVFGKDSGRDTIYDREGTPAEVDVLELGTGINPDDLWLQRRGSDLELSVTGTDDRVTLSQWYEGEVYQIEHFQTAQGQVLLHTQVESLVAAMAAFDPPGAGESTLPPEVRDQLEPVLAASWQPSQL